MGVEFSQMLGEKLGDCGWDGSRTAVAHGLTAGGGEGVLPAAAALDSGDDLVAGGLSGGPPQSDLLPQMAAFSCGCDGCGCCCWLAVARPLPTLESPVKPESILLALLVVLLLRLRSSWMNEFIAAMAADVEDVAAAATGEDGVSSLRLLELAAAAAGEELLQLLFRGFGDSNGASCYGHCWNSCIGCLV